MAIKKYVPNAITLLNMFSGCVALYFANINQIDLAAVFALLGIFFDFFDGFFARLPTPANTLLVISVALLCYNQPSNIVAVAFSNTYVLTAFVIFSSYILNAEIPLFALKFKTWDFRQNWMRYTLIVTTILLVILLNYTGILITILFYLLLSLTVNTISKQKL